MPRTAPPTSRALYARQVCPNKRTGRGDRIGAASGREGPLRFSWFLARGNQSRCPSPAFLRQFGQRRSGASPHMVFSMACLSDQATQTLKQAGKEDMSKSLEKAHADLVNQRVDYIEYGDPDRLTAKQRAKLNCQLLQQALVHRAERLMIATGQMFDSKNLYSLALIVRGHIEAVALLGYFARRLDSLHKGNIDFERFEEDIASGLLGAKDDIFDKAKAPVNILTCLEHTDKHLDTELFEKTGTFKEIYTWLSEFAHPNFLFK